MPPYMRRTPEDKAAAIARMERVWDADVEGELTVTLMAQRFNFSGDTVHKSLEAAHKAGRLKRPPPKRRPPVSRRHIQRVAREAHEAKVAEVLRSAHE